MAITSSGTAYLSKTGTSWLTVSFSLSATWGFGHWVKFTSWPVVNQTLVAFGTRTTVGITPLGKMYLTLNGVTVGESAALSLNKWYRWAYKQSNSATTHQLLIDDTESGSAPSFSTPSVDYSGSVSGGVPTSWTVFVYPNIHVCNLQFTPYISSDGASWRPTFGEGYWRAPLRHPLDLYDHRIVGAVVAGFPKFEQHHGWDTQSGTFSRVADPAALVLAMCDAFLYLETLAPTVTEPDQTIPTEDDTPEQLLPIGDFTIPDLGILPTTVSKLAVAAGAYRTMTLPSGGSGATSDQYFADFDFAGVGSFRYHGGYGVAPHDEIGGISLSHVNYFTWNDLGTVGFLHPITSDPLVPADVYDITYTLTAIYGAVAGAPSMYGFPTGTTHRFYIDSFYEVGFYAVYTGDFGDDPPPTPVPPPLPPVDTSIPCCAIESTGETGGGGSSCTCSSGTIGTGGGFPSGGGPSGSPSGVPSPGTSGPVSNPSPDPGGHTYLDLTYWTPLCGGGGQVPIVAAALNSENYDA